MTENLETATPEETFQLGQRLGASIQRGDVVMLYGGLGVGKTLLAKGILSSLNFDDDDVTSPSFTLVNLYKTLKFDVYHIDLWRLEGERDAASAVGLYEIMERENAVTIIEWADRLGNTGFTGRVTKISIEGDGGQPRRISIQSNEQGQRGEKAAS